MQVTLDNRLHTLRAEDEPAYLEAYKVLNNPKIPHKHAVGFLMDHGVGTSETAVRRFRAKQGVQVMGGYAPKHRAPEAVSEDPLDDVEPDELLHELLPDDDELTEIERLQERIVSLEADNRRIFKQYSQAKAKGEEMVEAVYRAAKDAAQYVGRTSPVPPQRDERPRSGEVALWHLTDWQGGKRTESYNRVIMRDRVKQYVDKAFSITEVQRADHPVREATILFTGDQVEGVSVFPGQVWELDGTLFEQMFDVSDLMAWTIQQALAIYESVQVVCEWGNHGRLGKKSDGIKPSDNVDRMCYQIVKDRLTDEDRITNFQLSGSWYQHFTIGNYSAVAIHGDEIKSFGGNVPAYGILRKANAWATGVLPSFTDLYLGHYHQAMQLQMANGGSVFMTGSPESDNGYAAEFVAATGRPSQRLNFVNPTRGQVTAEYRIWLD